MGQKNRKIRVRKVVGDERKFLYNPKTNVAIAARIEGTISEDALRGAVNKVKQMHPLVSTRVEIDSNGEAWFCSDNVAEIPVRIVERVSEDQWREELDTEHKIPFNMSAGPLIRFVLIQSSKVSELMVFCQHAICDGRALVYLLRDMLGFIAEPDKEVPMLSLPPLLSSEGVVNYMSKRSSLKKIIVQKYLKKLNQKWEKQEVKFDQEDFENIHQAFWQKQTYRMVILELSADQTDRLISHSRVHDVTVNSALCSAFLGAHLDVCGPFKGKHRIAAVPVDLRGLIKQPVDDTLCLYINRLLISFDYNPAKDVWHNARTFHDKVTTAFETKNLFDSFSVIEKMSPTFIDAMGSFGTLAKTVPEGYSRYAKLSSFAHQKKNAAVAMAEKMEASSPGLVFTNLGKANIANVYGKLKLDKMFFAPSTDERFPLVMGTVTVGGKLVVTINYYSENKTEDMTKIRDKAVELLGL